MNPLLHKGAVFRYDVGVAEQSQTEQTVIRDLRDAGDLAAYQNLPYHQSLVDHHLVLVVQLHPGALHTYI